ncbi:MAG TPA: DUF1499 domain-containing protein [Abditibacteriaceae bacterium]|jgi:uncharacterized protein (DUF1499 family)
MKKVLWILPVVTLVLFMAKRAGFLEPTNICQTRPDHAEVALRTRIYKASEAAVRAAALAAIKEQKTYLRSWKVVASEPDIHIEVPVLVFTDDLFLTLQAQESGTRVDIRSASRVGRGDFGENRRHVLQLLHTLDAQFLSFPALQKKVAEK